MANIFGRIGWRQSRQAAWSEADEQASAPPAAWETGLVPSLVASVVALYAVTFAILSILQHESFQTNAFDLGNMDQAVWNTLHGRPLEFTNWSGGNTRLAAHVEPILFLIAPLYIIYSSPVTLLVLQSVVLSLGALPAFWLARQVLRNAFAAAVCSFSYLLAPALEIANLADFHAVAFSSTLLLFAFYYAYQRRYLGFFIAAVLAMATKEHVPFTIFFMGLYIAWVQRRPRVGYAAAGIAFLWAATAFGFVLPHFNPEGASPYLSRYDQLGKGPLEIAQTMVFVPGATWQLATEPAKLDYVRNLFSPTLYLSLLSPATLVMALPDLSINLLSNFIEMYAGRAHYGAILVPVITISTILGLGHLRWLLARISDGLAQWGVAVGASLVLVSSLVSFWQQVFLPLTDHLPQTSARMQTARELMALIPPDAAVAAGSSLNPHVSQRRQVSLFPEIDRAEYVFLDVTASPYPIDTASQWWQTQQLLDGGGWGVVAARDGYLLLRRGALARTLPDEFFTFTKGDPKAERVPLALSFGGVVDLVGYQAEPGTTVHGPAAYTKLELFLQTRYWLPQDFLIAVSVVDEDEQKVYLERYQPTTLWHPPTRWVPGDLIHVQAPWLPLGAVEHAEVRVALVQREWPHRPVASLLPQAANAGSQDRLREDGTAFRIVKLQRGS